ncbi:MAG: alanine racemase [Eggerthellaceae bacterium]|nr:alanine racemase [Eggerthellaceae bacterium]
MAQDTLFDIEAEPSIPPQDCRWSWVQVDLDAIRFNTATAKRLVGNRRLLAVVKADAYGHGAPEVAQAALGAGADYLGVATVLEGVALRKAGITAPILILSEPPRTAIPLLVHFHIMPAVYTMDFALEYAEAADQAGLMAPFHLAVNTGMNRIGVRWDEVAEFMRSLAFHRAVSLVGTFTHFATADEPQSPDYQIQVRRFAGAINALSQAGISPGIVHCANTAATLRFPDVHCDMVRFGVGLYGLHPCPETRRLVELRPAMSVKARITDVRQPAMGEGVSYGMHYRTDGSVYICTIPVGYADGLARVLSDRIDVLWNGRRCPQVGNICMDQCMFEVDVRGSGVGFFTGSGAPGTSSGAFGTAPGGSFGSSSLGFGAKAGAVPQIGDEVVLVGRQGDEVITLDDLAAKEATIHYEVACDFGLRMPRVYC